jgi:GT2 family glycosyltransferase
MKLSIIIVSWNVKDDLLVCLRSLYENRPQADFETIVVDNASTDGTVDLLKKQFADLILIANTENRGFAAANNQAIKIAKGRYLFLLNPDIITHPQSLDNLIKVLDENPTAGACGPRIIDADGTTHPSVGYVPTFRSLLYGKTFFRSLGIFRSHYKKLTANDFDCDKQADVEQLSGAALMVRRSVIQQIGMMDENFFLYYEDADLCLRIREAGWKILYVPEAVVTHIGGVSSDQIPLAKYIMLYKSLFVYLRKYRGRLATALFGVVFKPGVIIRNILNIFSGTVVLIISILLFNRKRMLKSLTKIKRSAAFLAGYSWRFLFKI